MINNNFLIYKLIFIQFKYMYQFHKNVNINKLKHNFLCLLYLLSND